MLLILEGSSDVARAALADLIVKKRAAWRHLPTDDPGGVTALLGLDMRSNPEIGAMILAESIRALQEEGHHLVHAGEQDEMMAQLPELLGDECRRVFLASESEDEADGDYHLVLTVGKRSAQKTLPELIELLEEMEEMSRDA